MPNEKNKKSVFNRLFSLDGIKILSGYITPDSYFDVYIDTDKGKESKNIDILPEKSKRSKANCTSKYLRKNIQYNISFSLNHMIKLEPGFEAEVIIKKGTTNYKLNSLNPIIELNRKRLYN